MAIALECLKHDQLNDADALLPEVLAIVPDSPDALHYSGVLAHEPGRTDEAITLIDRSLGPGPASPTGKATSASFFSRRATSTVRSARSSGRLPFNPVTPMHSTTLGCCCGRREDDEAEGAYRAAIALEPLTPTRTTTWRSAERHRRTPEAVTCYCKALTLEAALSRGAPPAGARLLRDRPAGEGGSDVRGVAESRSPTIRSRGTRWRRCRAVTCRPAPRTPTCRRPSTVSRRASRSSSRSSTIVRRRWWRPTDRRGRPPSRPSTSSMPGAALDCAARCSRPSRVAWSVSICRRGCWRTRGRTVYDELVRRN